MKAPVIVLHRIKKLLSGAYGNREVHARIYTRKSPETRVKISSPYVSFTWPEAEKGPESPAFSPAEKRIDRLVEVLIAGAGALLFSIVLHQVDRLVPGVSIIPLLSILFLMFLAFFYEPWAIVSAGVILLGSSLISFLSFGNAFSQESKDAVFVLVRLAGFTATIGAVVLFSHSKRKAALALNEVRGVLEQMPSPLIISDSTGLIESVNEEAAALFAIRSSEMKGTKWAAWVMADIDEGTATRAYIELFAQKRSVGLPLNFHLSPNPKVAVKGRVMCVGTGQDKKLITVLQV
jgi:PAS domain-containing protein